MGTFRIASALNALAIIEALTAIASQAQPAQTVQAALSKEAGTLSEKFTGLARVMTGKYDWRPGQGVRSVGEVFNLIVTENGILAGTLTGATDGAKRAPISDPEKLQEALKTSYANLQQTIAGLSDADLKAPDTRGSRSRPPAVGHYDPTRWHGSCFGRNGMWLHRSGILRADDGGLIVRRQLRRRTGLYQCGIHAHRNRNACELHSGARRGTHRPGYCIAQRMKVSFEIIAARQVAATTI
jgi:hypothetical protein